MAGHSKWNNIKNRKAAVDAKKGKEFSYISKMIRIAVKQGKSGDLAANPALKVPFEKARAANMPKDKIQRAIDAGLGRRNGVAIQEILYEGFGPGGVGIMISAMTDNPQRTSAEMKFILSRNGGSLGGPGSASYLFQRSADGSSYEPAMPMVADDENTIAELEGLVEALRENEDVEDVYVAATWVDSAETEPK
jgi:YebC/PmpR family DNA-binding regulatory protein